MSFFQNREILSILEKTRISFQTVFIIFFLDLSDYKTLHSGLYFTKNGGVFEVPLVIIYELETKKATISPCHDNEDISRLCNLGKLFLLQYQPLSNTNPCHYKSCIFLNGRKNYSLFLRY